MSWNISIMGVCAPKDQIHAVVPDVFYKAQEGLSFEDVSSSSMGSALGVTYLNNWVMVINPSNAITFNPAIPLSIASQFEVLTFYVSEAPVFRRFEGGTVVQAVEGLPALRQLLKTKGIVAGDAYGETQVFQLLEHELLQGLTGNWMDHLFNAVFDRYELDWWLWMLWILFEQYICYD